MQGGKHQQSVLDATLRQNGDGMSWRNLQSEKRAAMRMTYDRACL